MKRFATLRPLVRRRAEDVGDTLQQMGRRLAATSERGLVQLRLVDGEASETFSVTLGAKRARTGARRPALPDVEIVTRAETWSRIVEGALSPLDAFVTGKLRLRGDAELAKRIVRHLSAGEGEVDVCR